MLNKNYAGTTASIIRSTFPNITAPKQTDLVSMLDQVGKDYQTGLQVRADNKLTDEMIAQNPEDEARIRQMGGRAYADMLKSDAQRAEERQWHLDDLESQRQFQRDLLRDKLNNDFALAKYKAGLGGGSTNAQQNVAAMIEAGYTPQEAWAMYYGGNNPTLDMATLGQKGQEQLGKETAKNYAEDLNSYNNMVSKMPELEETVKQLGELGKNATYTTAGQALDLFRRQSGLDPRQSAVDRASYISMIDNQVLPLLRDTFGAAFTEREGNTLRKTLGDPNTTPAEKQAQLDAFIRQKQKSIESQARKLESYSRPSLKQFNQTPSDDDAWGGI